MYFYGKLWKIYENNYNIECGFFMMQNIHWTGNIPVRALRVSLGQTKRGIL